MKIGKQIKEARKNKGLTQKEASQIIGITPSELCNYEKDKFMPSKSRLDDIAEAYGKKWEDPKLIERYKVSDKMTKILVNKLHWEIEGGYVKATSDHKGYHLCITNEREYDYSDVTIETFKNGDIYEIDLNFERAFADKAELMEREEEEKFKNEELTREINMYN